MVMEPLMAHYPLTLYTIKGKNIISHIFYTIPAYNRNFVYFEGNKSPKGDSLIIEVNGTVYTLMKKAESNFYSNFDVSIFPSEGTYTIKILSIE